MNFAESCRCKSDIPLITIRANGFNPFLINTGWKWETIAAIIHISMHRNMAVAEQRDYGAELFCYFREDASLENGSIHIDAFKVAHGED